MQRNAEVFGTTILGGIKVSLSKTITDADLRTAAAAAAAAADCGRAVSQGCGWLFTAGREHIAGQQ